MDKFIIASGPVILENKKLLVIKDEKDNFYKLPGGTVESGSSLEDTCIREVKEEIGGMIEIIKPLHPMVVYKNPQTDKEMTIVLIHYLSKLQNRDSIRPISPIKEVKFLEIEKIMRREYDVAPNIRFLIEKGDIYL